MVLSGDAADPVEGSNTEDEGDGVGGDASNFGEGAADRISSTKNDDEATDTEKTIIVKSIKLNFINT